MLGYENYKELLNRFKQLLKEKFGANLISIVLFGSVARNTAGVESDIDLLIIIKEAPSSYYKRLEPIIGIELKLRQSAELTKDGSPMLSTIILSRDEALENRNIFLDMIEDSIILYDQDSFFKNRLKDIQKRLFELGSKKIILEDRTWYWKLKPDLEPGEVFEV